MLRPSNRLWSWSSKKSGLWVKAYSSRAASEPSVRAGVVSEKPQLLEDARLKFLNAGFDPKSFLEQNIVWGDQDAFQHVNNVRYARFFESARIKWMMSIGEEWGGLEKAEAMIRGKGVSLILQNLDIRFKRPVTYPDTLLIGYAPVPSTSEDAIKFQVVATAYSLTMQQPVAHSKETLVWYDYDHLKKCHPPKDAARIISERARHIDSKALLL